MKRALVFSGAALLLSVGFAQAEIVGDPAKGEKLFKRCVSCHKVGPKAKNGQGPQLNGIMDRQIATVEGFRYSKAFKKKKEAEPDFAWSVENLDQFLIKPKKFIKKTKMQFPGFKDRNDKDKQKRADVIAYLKQFDAEGKKIEAE